jgi:hypothetical protein
MNSSKRVMKMWKMMNEIAVKDFRQLMDMLKNCGMWSIQIDVSVSTTLIMWKYLSGYMKLCTQKGLNFGPMTGFSTVTMPQPTRCSVKQFLA